MGFLSRLLRRLETLPDLLIYTVIAIGATGAVLSTIHHVKSWKPSKRKSVKLKGADGKKIEDSLPTWALGNLARHVNFNVAFAAKKILIERALSDPCQDTLIKRLESTNVNIRIETLWTLKYIFEFKYKTKNFAQDNQTMLQVLSFAFSHSESLLIALARSIDSPEATKLAIQNLTFLMRIHKQFRSRYARNPLFREWRLNPRNPLYSLTTVEGLLLVHEEPSREDLYLSEVQQFIYYIGEKNWPFDDTIPLRVRDRFKQIWAAQSANKPILPFPDPGERWETDEDSEQSDSDENGEMGDIEMTPELAEAAREAVQYISGITFDNGREIVTVTREGVVVGNHEDEEDEEDEGSDRESVDFLEEPEPVTPEDLLAYFHAAEEAGLRSQDRRRGRRRQVEGQREN